MGFPIPKTGFGAYKLHVQPRVPKFKARGGYWQEGVADTKASQPALMPLCLPPPQMFSLLAGKQAGSRVSGM